MPSICSSTACCPEMAPPGPDDTGTATDDDLSRLSVALKSEGGREQAMHTPLTPSGVASRGSALQRWTLTLLATKRAGRESHDSMAYADRHQVPTVVPAGRSRCCIDDGLLSVISDKCHTRWRSGSPRSSTHQVQIGTRPKVGSLRGSLALAVDPVGSHRLDQCGS